MIGDEDIALLIHLFGRDGGHDVGGNDLFLIGCEHSVRLEFAAIDRIDGKTARRVDEPPILDGERDWAFHHALDLIEKDPGKLQAFITNVSFLSIGSSDEGASSFESFIAEALENCRQVRVNLNHFRYFVAPRLRHFEMAASFADCLFDVVCYPGFGEGADDRRIVSVSEGVDIADDPFQLPFAIGVFGEEDVFVN